jgi:hypothetical protein
MAGVRRPAVRRDSAKAASGRADLSADDDAVSRFKMRAFVVERIAELREEFGDKIAELRKIVDGLCRAGQGNRRRRGVQTSALRKRSN